MIDIFIYLSTGLIIGCFLRYSFIENASKSQYNRFREIESILKENQLSIKTYNGIVVEEKDYVKYFS